MSASDTFYSGRRCGRRQRHTVDSALELLIADLAGEVTDAGLLVKLDGHRVLVVAE
jgi:hypothetical protein